MGRKMDLTGQRFGHLTVLEPAEPAHDGKPRWVCKCDCGTIIIKRSATLRRGSTRSCGCRNGLPLYMRRVHGNRLYNIWAGMKYRCNSPSSSRYNLYGGRGITVCDEWQNENGFETFAEWSISHGYQDNLEIDRIDNDQGYKPDNCRWVEHDLNSRNRGHGTAQKGISFRPNKAGDGGKCRASIMYQGENIHLGSFDTYEEAVEARKRGEIKYWGWQKSK